MGLSTSAALQVRKIKVEDKNAIVVGGDNTSFPLNSKEYEHIPDELKVDGVYYANCQVIGGSVRRFLDIFHPDDRVTNIILGIKDARGKGIVKDVVHILSGWLRDRGYALNEKGLVRLLNKTFGSTYIVYQGDTPITEIEGLIASMMEDQTLNWVINADDAMMTSQNAGYIPKELIVDTTRFKTDTYERLIRYETVDRHGNVKEKLYYVPDTLKREHNSIMSLIEGAQSGLTTFRPFMFQITGMSGDGKTAFANAVMSYLEPHQQFKIAGATVSDDSPEAFFLFPRLRNASVEYEERSYNGQTISEFLGSDDLKILFIDELNRAEPSAINGFLNLLDDSGLMQLNGETVEIGNNLIVLATANIGWEYTGTTVMDAAFLNRSSSFVKMPLLSYESALDLAKQVYPNDMEFIREFFKILRNAQSSSKTRFFATQRIIDNAVRMYNSVKTVSNNTSPMSTAIKQAMSTWLAIADTFFNVDEGSLNSIEEAVNVELSDLENREHYSLALEDDEEDE